MALIVHPDNNLWRESTLNPFDQAQKGVVISLVECVSECTVEKALADPPSTRTTYAVSHSRDREETEKVVYTTIRPCKTMVSA